VEVDGEALTRVAERFLRRKETRELGLSLEDVKQVLLQHAQRYGGCVNCAYSSPYHGRFSWTARHCVLGLRQDTCKMYKPIIA
jgi:hypothetical protein